MNINTNISFMPIENTGLKYIFQDQDKMCVFKNEFFRDITQITEREHENAVRVLSMVNVDIVDTDEVVIYTSPSEIYKILIFFQRSL